MTQAEEAASAALTPKKRALGSGPLVNATPPHWAQERLEFLGVLVIVAVLSPFPPKWKGRIAEAVGRLLGPLIPGVAKRAQQNFDRVRPHYDAETRRRIIRQVCGGFARTAVDYLYLPWIRAESAGCAVEGLEHLEAAKVAGGGRLVVISGHFGNWEAIRSVAAAQGAPLGIIYRAFNNRLIDRYFYGRIALNGGPAFRKGAEGSKQLLGHIRSGGGVLILVDQRSGGAPFVDFMGEPAETSLAAAKLARSLKAPLLPAVARRVGDGFAVRFEAAIPPGDAADMMAEANRRIAAWIDEDPGQWFWLHRRWRRRTGNEPAVDG